MGVIYKILKQQRQQQCINMDLSTTTKCKVQAAIKQRQMQRHQQQEQLEQQDQQNAREDIIAEQQLQQLCQFLAENAARKKRQRQRLSLQQQHAHNHRAGENVEQPLCELQSPQAATTHDMDLLMEHLSECSTSSSINSTTDVINSPATTTTTTTTTVISTGAPRDSILLKIRHQIFERKRQRQRQLAQLVKQRLVVWRPW